MANEIDIFEDGLHEALPANDKELNQARLHEWIGQRKFSAALQKLLTISDLVEIQRLKESKAYKGMRLIVDEKVSDVSTFEQFCKSFGASAQHINEQLLNLKTFGPEFLESAENLIGYREMRLLRKLPVDQNEALRELAKENDPQALAIFAENLIEKHIKEKSELTAKAEDLEQDLKDSGKRINNMNAEIERNESELMRLKSKQRLTKFEELTEDVRDECMHLQAGCELNLNSLQKLFVQVFYDEPTPEQQLRIEQVYVAASVAASRAFTVLETLQELMTNAELSVERIQGQHILTPPEAERWLLDAQMLESKHEAEKLAREVKREADKPKGRGRPSGSKNKIEA